MSLAWGIIGARSGIFTRAIEPHLVDREQHEIVARASRDASGTDAPYAALLADPAVEAVYIPLPNGLHREWVERALAAGKHVLCEKPLGMDAAEAEAMYDAARAAGRVLGEAYAPPYHPLMRLVSELVAGGEIGELLFAHHTFSYLHPDPAHDHRLDPVLGNGSLLDLGCYVVGPLLDFASREPVRIAASARLSNEGVDTSLSGWLDFGAWWASIETSFDAPNRRTQELAGTRGVIRREQAWFPGPEVGTVDLVRPDDSVEVHGCATANAYREMLDAFERSVRAGEPLRFGVDESLRLARTLDRIAVAARSRTGSVET